MKLYKHHIIPYHAWKKCHKNCNAWEKGRNFKHTCGFDDPSNILVCTLKSHAEEHKWRFIELGNKEDALAWLALSGSLSKEELILEKARLGGMKGGKRRKGVKNSESQNKMHSKWMKEHPISKETRDKINTTLLSLGDNHWTKRKVTRLKMSTKAKNREKCKCHCGKEGPKPQMIQWHFDNCKVKQCAY
jgi:hypothetical protein